MAEEKKLQTSILDDLRSMKDCFCFKIMKASDDSIPDIFFTTLKSGSVFVEVKSPGKIPSPSQQRILDLLSKCGAKSFSCDSWSGWIKIKQTLGILH